MLNIGKQWADRVRQFLFNSIVKIIKTPQDSLKRIYEDKIVQVLYKQSRISLPGTWITALLAVTVFWREAEHKLLLTWFFLYSVYLVVRHLICLYHSHPNKSRVSSAAKIMIFAIMSGISGSCWGYLAIQLIPEVSTTYDVVVFLFAGGLSASAVASYAVALKVSYSFIIPFIGSILWIAVFQESSIHLTMAAMMLLYMIVLLMTNRQMNLSVVESFHLEAKNIQLVADLKKAKTDQENLNRELVEEINLKKSAEIDLKKNLAVLESAKKDIEKVDNAKGIFLATMSHEIRTPLNIIIMAANKLNKTKRNPENVNYAEMILSSGEVLLRFVNEILDHASIDSKKIKLEIAEFNLRKLLEKILQIYQPEFKKRAIGLHYEFDADAGEIMIQDPFRVRQIMINLLDNALTFTLSGRISVKVMPGENSNGRKVWSILVSDTGEGISASRIADIFEPFVQADSSSTHRRKGAGLGLSICKKLVDLMGGEIGVKSSLGKGTSFQLTLPELEKTDKNRSPAANVFKKGRKKSFNEQWRILLAEDDAVNSFLIQDLLEQAGHQVCAVDNGAKAIKAVDSEPFDLVLMDINMPVMDGLQAIHAIREQEKNSGRRLPVIALTAMVFSDDRDKCLVAGADGFLAKPISPDSLISAVGRFVGSTGRPGAVHPATGPRRIVMDDLLQRSSGRMEVMENMVNLFLKKVPKVRHQIEQAAATEDTVSLRQAAHKLKGMVSFFTDKGLLITIQEVERASALGCLGDINQILPDLLEELDRFICELKNIQTGQEQ